MRKALPREITMCFFCQGLIIVTAISVPVENAHEVKSSYYLISTQAAEKCILTEVNNILDEEGCLSICNKNDGCIDAVYNTGSCLLKLNPKHNMNGKAVEISKGENTALFKKLGRSFDFESRTFQGIPQGEKCGSRSVVALPKSCKEIYERNRLATNGNYSIWPNGVEGQKQNVYCQMTRIPGCRDGGWTLVMKIDGNKGTFGYHSTKWAKTEAYNPASAFTGLDLTEMVSPAYWTTPLNKLCLGMKKQNEMNWVLVPVAPAQSLHSLIASNNFTSTHLGRGKWKTLLSNSYLQSGCEREGFNAFINAQKVRIGMVAGKRCNSPGSSMIGFGTTTYVTAGNFKSSVFPIDKRGVHSFGYILVQ